MANDKFFLAKKTDAVLTAEQVDTLQGIAAGTAYTAVEGDAVAVAAAATATVADTNSTEILADVDEIRTKLNALLTSLKAINVIG